VNIFVVDYDPAVAAQALHDKHIVKMSLEAAELLCSAFPPERNPPYKRGWYHHPCAVWARTSELNYLWLLEHAKALCREFEHRYGHSHASAAVIKWCEDNRHYIHYSKTAMTPFPRVMPAQYVTDDAVESYRAYYRGEKLAGTRGFHTWTHRDKPFWLNGDEITLH
jgi:hypothetical protein